ncbi:MAG: anti-sigma factor [Luteimonas sp.]
MNTSYDDRVQDPPEGDMLAGEYVLGVLDASQQRAAMQRMQSDVQFAGEVAAWERHFAPWLDSIAPMAVPDHIWPRIQQTLGLLGPMRADRIADRARTPARASWWDNVSVWRWLGAGGLAAAAASLFALMVNLQRPQTAPALPPIATVPTPEPVTVPVPAPVIVPVPEPALAAPDMVAAITTDDGTAAYLASIDSQHGKIMMVPMAVDIPAGQVPELWVIAGGGAPQSLGVLDPTRAHSVDIPETMRSAFAADAVVAISLEPPGGSPTGQPTGPVIAKGAISVI